MNQEQQIKNLKRLAYQHLGLAHELCGHVHLSGVAHIPEIDDSIKRIHAAGDAFDEYIETGKLPDWMQPNVES